MINERHVATQPVSPDPLRSGEQEALTWMAFDRTDCVDHGRVAYARRPNGEPVFEDPEVTRAATPLAGGEPSVA
ncbi:hypothetical protein GCM10023191_036920 [Actinoallomurus oryzae]|uniref:Uncharacterized protein n=1 Tax=Actinoallomurus oryzae TaxID=502180 RepID=A0ABP8Q3H6_9ACTN